MAKNEKNEKKLISARVNIETADMLSKFCQEHALIKSAFIEKAIIHYIKFKKETML